MKKTLSIVMLLAAIFIVAASSPAQTKVRDSMIVSTEWLAKHLDDEGLILLQVGDRKDYDTAPHIKGAQYIQSSDVSMPRGQGLTLELAPVDQIKAVLEKLGVNNNSRIVVYFSKDWVTPTARIYFVLDYMGLGDRSSILDGGLPAWVAEKRPVTAEVTTPKAGSLAPHVNSKLVVDAPWVSGNINKPGVAILDARDSKFYTGEAAGNHGRAGHIPSARSIPFATLVEDSNKFKSPEALRTLFNSAGVKPKDTVATYCHIGQQASLLYFVAKYLGYDAHLYDGSFDDWSQRPDSPLDKSEAKPPAKPN